MVKRNKIILIFTLLLVLTGCFKRPAIGKDSRIYVLADKQTYERHKDKLEKIFADTLWTPSPEFRYYVKRAKFDEFEDKKLFRNVILLCDVDRDTPESKFTQSLLSSDVIQGVKDGRYAYIFKEDLWARDQNILFLMDSDNDKLTEVLDSYEDKLLAFFVDNYRENAESYMFTSYDRDDIEEEILKKYNVSLSVPSDYHLINEGKDVEFFRLRRFAPDRWLTYIRGQYNPDFTMQENIINLRDKAGLEFGDVTKVNPAIISFEPDTTFAENGVLCKGIWEYKAGGGPFFCYAFTKGNLLYLIDGAVFNPGEDKYPYIEQLHLMAKKVKINYN